MSELQLWLYRPYFYLHARMAADYSKRPAAIGLEQGTYQCIAVAEHTGNGGIINSRDLIAYGNRIGAGLVYRGYYQPVAGFYRDAQRPYFLLPGHSARYYGR